jgi:hypothetical protein
MLGELLVARGLISRAQLDSVLAEELATGKRLSEIVVRQGLASETELMSALIEQLGLEISSVEESSEKPDFERLDIELAQEETFRHWDGLPEEASDYPLATPGTLPPVARETRLEQLEEVRQELVEIKKALSDVADAVRHENRIGFA